MGTYDVPAVDTTWTQLVPEPALTRTNSANGKTAGKLKIAGERSENVTVRQAPAGSGLSSDENRDTVEKNTPA